jgi:osmotically inducible protein OsmC
LRRGVYRSNFESTNQINNNINNKIKNIMETLNNTTSNKKVLYTGKIHTTGGRDGAAKSNDGRLDIKLSSPGTSGSGTNPEQLLAAGWSACFIGAMGHAAAQRKIRVPADVAVDTEVDLVLTDGAYTLQARLNISLPGIEPEVARELAEAAHQTCPYSKALKGNIDITLNIA